MRKKIHSLLNSRIFYIQCAVMLFVASRVLVFSPELWKLEKYKRKLPPPNILREISFEQCFKNIRYDNNKPNLKINKRKEQAALAADTKINLSLLDETERTFTPYFGQYIDPPKLG
jgi:hypothetical protein